MQIITASHSQHLNAQCGCPDDSQLDASLSATEDSILESRRLTWYAKIKELIELDSLLQASAAVSQSEYDTAVQQSTAAQTQYEQYVEGLAQSRDANIEALLTLNAAVTTSSTPDANHKTVNGIVLNFLLSDTLASGKLAALEAIAGQCPLEGGDAVYEARAFVTYMTGADFDDAEICAASEERQQRPEEAKKLSENEGVLLYPNPTAGQVFWSGTGDKVIVLKVFNALGQLLLEKMANDNHADLSRLPGGLYVLQILAADNTLLATQKIQIVKN